MQVLLSAIGKRSCSCGLRPDPWYRALMPRCFVVKLTIVARSGACVWCWWASERLLKLVEAD